MFQRFSFPGYYADGKNGCDAERGYKKDRMFETKKGARVVWQREIGL